MFDKVLNFDKELPEKELVIWQLRFIYPTVNQPDLEKLYWVWKTPNYLREWVNNNLTKNILSARVAEQRLIEFELLESGENNRVSDSTNKGRKTTKKNLNSHLINILSATDITVCFNLKLKTND